MNIVIIGCGTVGGNVIENVFYVKSEFLPFKKASEEEKKAADEWFESILPQLK